MNESFYRIEFLINGQKECLDFVSIDYDLLECDDHEMGYGDDYKLKAFIIISLHHEGVLKLEVKEGLVKDEEHKGYRCPHCEEWVVGYDESLDYEFSFVLLTKSEHKLENYGELWLCNSCGNLISNLELF